MNHQDALTALGQVTEWRKSSYSQGQSNCVEVARVPGWIGLRDSKLGPTSPTLVFTDAEWAAFTAGARDNEFDL